MVQKQLNVVGDVKEKKSKTKLSRFFITINSNKTDPIFGAKLQKAYSLWYQYLDDPKADLIKFVSGEAKDMTKVLGMNVDMVLERGPLQGKYHIHSIVDITHETKVQINLSKLRSFMNLVIGSPCHINIVYVKDVRVSLMQYLQKSPVKEE
jgi:hypothetical protein